MSVCTRMNARIGFEYVLSSDGLDEIARMDVYEWIKCVPTANE